MKFQALPYHYHGKPYSTFSDMTNNSIEFHASYYDCGLSSAAARIDARHRSLPVVSLSPCLEFLMSARFWHRMLSVNFTTWRNIMKVPKCDY